VNATTEQLIATILTWVIALGTAVSAAIWYMRTGPVQEPADEVTERIPKYSERRPRLLVVAGDYRQFEEYCAGHRLNRFCDAVYVGGPRGISEHRSARFVMTGTYMLRPDLLEILTELAAADCTRM
jgi:hypothetical protein